ncbi:glycosyltransferase family 2 protein [Spirosoma sp. BT702]|uniref:Glycosyltransferase family 2 protein n=2 Tax=Spirosoma profusum TaxID=2771354 RepID=A0A926XUG5_9BACT|nr:glycosyltransferase family 2 protein [Spirosoma profusum]
MATYNGEKYILRQLQSILSQLNPEDEVIISDDNSTDTTLAIIVQIGDKRIKVYKNQGLRGPLHNFEQAIRHASGNYIILSDQDDVWMPDKAQTIRSLLKNHDLVLTNCEVVDQNGTIIHASYFKHRGTKSGFWHNLYKNSYMGCCMAFRREILTYVMPFPTHIHMHDWWIGLLVELKGSVCFYPQPLLQYFRHGENASTTGEPGYGLLKRLKHRVFMLWHVAARILSR